MGKDVKADTFAGVHELHLLICCHLRDRMDAVKAKGKADSLFVAFVDVQFHQYSEAFHTLTEAIEDGESLDAKEVN